MGIDKTTDKLILIAEEVLEKEHQDQIMHLSI